MKKTFFTLALFSAILIFSSCRKDHDDNDYYGSQTAPNLEARATDLGFESIQAYTDYVDEQCALGNHQNCDIYTDGTHQPCGYADHNGQNHDGTHHNGTDHGQHNENGHNHNGKHH